MAYFLAIESAIKNCSVALFENEKLIDYKDLEGSYSHSENLAAFVNELIQTNFLKAEDIDAVAVSKGPGSYTGLRIGVSFAKGFCFAREIPLIGISTLKAMANAARIRINDENGLYCPFIDARRLEVYTSTFDFNLNQISPITSQVLTTNSFSEELKKSKIYFFGDGSDKAKDILSSENSIFLNETFTSARYFGDLIVSAFRNKEFEDLAYFEPFYLKNFIAGKPKKLV